MNLASAALPAVAQLPVGTIELAEKISIRSLDFYYGGAQALKGIDLALYQNKVTAIIGPSGCGKSTLLRVLNRMYDLYPDQRAEGEIRFDGEDILSPDQDLNLLRARIGIALDQRVDRRLQLHLDQPAHLADHLVQPLQFIIE